MLRLEASSAAIQAWLEAAENHERLGTFRDIRLERIRTFMAGRPPPPAPLTVAGTKGKGSTVRLAEAALRAHGLPTLAFTSPHVSSVLERWRLDGAVASPALVAEACAAVAAAEGPGPGLSYFERTFAVACELARLRAGTQFLCEVGLGGRLDCANALDCRVAVLSHLSHDHREILGPTLGHIATEKLAVCRAGSPLVVAPQSPAAAAAITARLPAGVEAVWVERPARPFTLAMAGDHQQDNAATAWQAVQRLHPGLDEERARAGMATTELAARCQLLIRGDRRILVDGAHNGPSIAATLAVARARLRTGFTLILGLARDKEVEEVLAAIGQGTQVLRCGYDSPRARGPADWPAPALAWTWHERVGSALAAASSLAPDRDLCISGSFYLAGEALIALGADGALPG